MAQWQSTVPASQSTTENSPPGKSAKFRPAPPTKIFRLTCRANHHYKLAPSHPDEGRIARRHERAVGCDGRDSVGRATGSQGGFPVSDSDGARTNDAATRLRQNSPDRTRSGKTFGVGWSRTAKSCGPGAPMLASSLAEMHPAQPGSRWIVNPKGDGGKQAGHRGEPEVSRNPFAQGKPE